MMAGGQWPELNDVFESIRKNGLFSEQVQLVEARWNPWATQMFGRNDCTRGQSQKT